MLTLDISGLGTLLGSPQTIGEELRRTAADRGLFVHVAIAATQTTAILLARARAGLTVVPPGSEAATLAPLPLVALARLRESRLERAVFSARGQLVGVGPHESEKWFPTRPKRSLEPPCEHLSRWGLRTLGDLASLPVADLSERLGQEGVIWQRLARGEDVRPLVPSLPQEVFEESLELEWPIEGLEPLSFVLGRLCEPLCARLERRDRGAVALHLRLKLVTRQVHERCVQLPVPMRDARVLRTLALLDLESHPPSAAIDQVTVAVDVTEGRVLQFALFTRALPSAERLSTLLAWLAALMGSDRVGAAALVDSPRPGAFVMTAFLPERESLRSSGRSLACGAPSAAAALGTPRGATRALRNADDSVSNHLRADRELVQAVRRFRLPIPVRVTLENGRPVRVVTDRRGFIGGRVERCAGPWRTSGDWWNSDQSSVVSQQSSVSSRQPTGNAGLLTVYCRPSTSWDRDEWDVVLSDGAAYRIYRARDRDMWFLDGILD